MTPEEQCYEYAIKLRWGGIPQCPYCLWYAPMVTNRGFRCFNKECNKKFTITSGTLLDNTKMSIMNWFYLIGEYCRNRKISSAELARRSGVTQKTSWNALKTIKFISSGLKKGSIRERHEYILRELLKPEGI